MPDFSQQLLAGLYGRPIAPQFGIGAGPGEISGTGPTSIFGGNPNRGPRLHHTPPPPQILPSIAHNALDWLVGNVKSGVGKAFNPQHLSMEDANNLIRMARTGYLQFDPTGMMVRDLDPTADPRNRGWMNFGIDPNKARQVMHAQRAISLLQQIQQKHGGTRQERGYQ